MAGFAKCAKQKNEEINMRFFVYRLLYLAGIFAAFGSI